MQESLKDKVVVVTGASRGIGKAIAQEQARRGARVVLAARSRGALDESVQEILSDGGEALAVPADVTNKVQVKGLLVHAVEHFGPPDVLVCAAGSLASLGPLWDTEPDEWVQDLRVNVEGVYLCCRFFLPAMMERGSGRIINIVGGGTTKPFLHASGYGTSKAAVMRLTESLAQELDEHASPVRAFALNPGFVHTEMTEQFRSSERGQRWMKRMAQRLERGDAVSPHLAAEMVAQIASGRLDAFHGRYLNSEKDLDQLEQLVGAVPENEDRTLRIQQQ
jgi:NAD(P)-dependent dehydrogenase (short-subunit alcohol dehydrogenase family)